ncbi:MAG: hypothetical protein HYZ15_03290 [Sphingobacteriales bacterium]|nr:hypothetical protein [Sphingobacteriales bacterium]
MGEQDNKSEKNKDVFSGDYANVPQEDIVTKNAIEAEGQPTKESDSDADMKYQDQLNKYYEGIAQIKAYRLELLELFKKSQDTFEKQLSYISTGALALSVGFIKDIVHPLKDSCYKWMLLTGWGLMILTLLLNLISHMVAGHYAKKGAQEASDIENSYDPKKIDKRASFIDGINWTTIAMLSCGIILIVLYITLNAVL